MADNKRPGKGIIRRAFSKFRTEGLRGVWRKVRNRLSMKPVYRRALVMQLSFTDALPTIEPKIPVTFGELKESDFDEFLALRPYLTEEVLELRLEAGNYCYVAKLNGEIVHSRFVGIEKAYTIYLRTVLPLAPHEVYIYDSYTVPEYKGNSISPAYTLFLSEKLRQLGYRHAVAFIRPDNRPSLRAAYKLGYQIKGHIGFVEVFGIRRYFYWANDGGFDCLDNAFFVLRDKFVPAELQGQIW